MHPGLPESADRPDRETTDLVRLLRWFAVRAFVLAAVVALAGLTTLAMALTVAGFGLLFAPVRDR